MDNARSEAIVVEGKNPEEALQAACDRLKTTPNQVEYEVLDGGRAGVFGFLKGRTIKVRVWRKSAAQKTITELVQGMFSRMGVDARLRVTQADDGYDIELESSDADGLLIGRGGETLKALQHLVSRMVGQKDEALRVRLDVAGYRKRRHEQLRRKAKDLAERALARNRDELTEPLPADERRIVHLALAEDGRVETRALGDGEVKRVAICPLAGARPGNADRPGRARARSDRGERVGRGERRERIDRGEHSEGEGGDSRDHVRGGGGRHSGASGSRPGGRPRGRGHGRGDDLETAGAPRRRREPGFGGGEGEGRRSRRPSGPRPEAMRPAALEEEAPAAVDREADQMSAGGDTAEKPDYRRPRKLQLPSTDQSYFTIPEAVEEAGQEGDEPQPEEGQSAPLTWGRRRRAGRGRR